MAVPESAIPAALDLSFLEGSFWYCPAPNLPAPLIVNGPDGPVVTFVQDQTVWHIRETGLGYVFADCATNIGGNWTYSTIAGSITPDGRVLFGFTPDSALMSGPGGITTTTVTQGTGTLTNVGGEPAFLMQMFSGTGAVGFTHWAYMLRMEAGDAAWNDLPGTVPRGVEEVFRVGSTANSTVPGIEASGSGRADYLYGSDRTDRLLGNGGADTLDGGDAADFLAGGAGNDLLLGGNGADRLLGGTGADTLAGGAGPNVLTGNGGADTFRFDAPDGGVRDTVTDFLCGEDRIAIDASGFGLALAPGAMPEAAFTVPQDAGGPASHPAHRFVYQRSGELFFDPDGNTRFLGPDGHLISLPQILIAKFTGAPQLDASDFLIIA